MTKRYFLPETRMTRREAFCSILERWWSRLFPLCSPYPPQKSPPVSSQSLSSLFSSSLSGHQVCPQMQFSYFVQLSAFTFTHGFFVSACLPKSTKPRMFLVNKFISTLHACSLFQNWQFPGSSAERLSSRHHWICDHIMKIVTFNAIIEETATGAMLNSLLLKVLWPNYEFECPQRE